MGDEYVDSTNETVALTLVTRHPVILNGIVMVRGIVILSSIVILRGIVILSVAKDLSQVYRTGKDPSLRSG
jgi:hypothetical protein